MRTRQYTPGAIERRTKTPPSSPTSRKKALVTFLGTPLGLWLLSTLFISFASWAFATYSAKDTKSTDNRDRIDLLDQEIERRLYLFYPLYASKREDRLLDRYSVDDELVFPKDANRRIFQKPAPEDELHPQFKDRNLLSLMYELRGLLRSVDQFEADCVASAIEAVRRVEPFWRKRTLGTIEDFRDLYTRLETIRDKRWSDEAQTKLVPYQYARITGGDDLTAWKDYNCMRERELKRIKGQIPYDF